MSQRKFVVIALVFTLSFLFACTAALAATPVAYGPDGSTQLDNVVKFEGVASVLNPPKDGSISHTFTVDLSTVENFPEDLTWQTPVHVYTKAANSFSQGVIESVYEAVYTDQYFMISLDSISGTVWTFTVTAYDTKGSKNLEHWGFWGTTASCDNPCDDPGDTPGGNSGGTPGGNPGDNPGGNPGDTSGGNPGDTSGGNPGDTPGGNPGDTSGGNPGDNCGGNPGDTSGGNPGDTSGGNPGGTSGGNPGDTSGGNPGDNCGDDSSNDTSGDSSNDTSGDSDVDTGTTHHHHHHSGTSSSGDNTLSPEVIVVSHEVPAGAYQTQPTTIPKTVYAPAAAAPLEETSVAPTETLHDLPFTGGNPLPYMNAGLTLIGFAFLLRRRFK